MTLFTNGQNKHRKVRIKAHSQHIESGRSRPDISISRRVGRTRSKASKAKLRKARMKVNIREIALLSYLAETVLRHLYRMSSSA
jgi:hypothetical protein